jgi:hypothetical protein
MQLILRQPAVRGDHDDPNGVVVAASPDTLGREQWLWDIRMTASAPDYAIAVSHNPDVIQVEQDRIYIDGEHRFERDAHELWIAVALKEPITHGIFQLESGDIAVWEGDDPRGIHLLPIDESAEIQLIRISRRDGKAARWVP